MVKSWAKGRYISIENFPTESISVAYRLEFTGLQSIGVITREDFSLRFITRPEILTGAGFAVCANNPVGAMQTDSPDRINTNVLNFIRGMVKGEKMGKLQYDFARVAFLDDAVAEGVEEFCQFVNLAL